MQKFKGIMIIFSSVLLLAFPFFVIFIADPWFPIYCVMASFAYGCAVYIMEIGIGLAFFNDRYVDAGTRYRISMYSDSRGYAYPETIRERVKTESVIKRKRIFLTIGLIINFILTILSIIAYITKKDFYNSLMALIFSLGAQLVVYIIFIKQLVGPFKTKREKLFYKDGSPKYDSDGNRIPRNKK